MDVEEDGLSEEEPVSPTGQYFNSSVLNISLLCVLEFEIPINVDDSQVFSLLKDVFLPISPRFSSIMVKDKNGIQQWRRVEVKIQEHVHIPKFQQQKSNEFYDESLNSYLSKISADQLSQTKPLWEIHIIKYPTSNAAGSLVFKLHHALGDGFSLMGALLSCLQRADNPTLPLTFPNFQSSPNGDLEEDGKSSSNPFRVVKDGFGGIVNTVCDFGWSLLKSSIVEDEKTPIRSGDAGVEFRPINIFTMDFSLDQIKEIKSSLEVTINDLITGIIFLGTRLYMESAKKEMKNANSTALVLLNTRNIGGYKSVKEMVKNQTANTQWGNQFGFLHVSLPELNGSGSINEFGSECSNPVEFVYNARKIIQRKRNSSAVFLTGHLLEAVRKVRGPQATAEYIHSTLKNSSMTVSNMIGPLEQMSLANHPVKGLYFMVLNVPQSLTITIMSYMKKLRIGVGTEKGLIDPVKFKACIQNAFDMMLNDALNSKSQPNSSSGRKI